MEDIFVIKIFMFTTQLQWQLSVGKIPSAAPTFSYVQQWLQVYMIYNNISVMNENRNKWYSLWWWYIGGLWSTYLKSRGEKVVMWLTLAGFPSFARYFLFGDSVAACVDYMNNGDFFLLRFSVCWHFSWRIQDDPRWWMDVCPSWTVLEHDET
jgi:hypothetical protein